jgi:hypothetical protein
MNVAIDYRPSYATAKVDLSPGEEIVVEAGAMVAMSTGLELQTKAGGRLPQVARASHSRREAFFLVEEVVVAVFTLSGSRCGIGDRCRAAGRTPPEASTIAGVSVTPGSIL